MIGVGLVVGVGLRVGLAGVARIGVDKIGGVDTVGSAPLTVVVTGASVNVPSAALNPDLSVVGAGAVPPAGAAFT